MHITPVGIVAALAVLAIVVALLSRAFTHDDGVDLGKHASAEPMTAPVHEGTVMRIAVMLDDYGTSVHLLLEEAPNAPITLTVDPSDPTIPLTMVGDRVRVERHDEDEYAFANLTTGLSVTED